MANMKKVLGGASSAAKDCAAKKAVVKFINSAGVEQVLEAENILDDEIAAKAHLKALENALVANGFKVKSSRIIDAALSSITGGAGKALREQKMVKAGKALRDEKDDLLEALGAENPKHKPIRR